MTKELSCTQLGNDLCIGTLACQPEAVIVIAEEAQRFVPERTCHFIPDVMHTCFDEDDNEIDTCEADPDGCVCSCSECGEPMMTGELGWFDEEEGEYGGIVYKPRFNYCPNCGAKVVD